MAAFAQLASAVLLVVVGALVGAGLRRWFDPLPRRVLQGFVLLVLVQMAPALLGGRVALPLHLLTTFPPYEALAPAEMPPNLTQADLVHEVAPTEITVRSRLAAGEWPLWNPAVGAGMPLLADPQAHARWLAPLAWPALVVPLPEAFAAGAAVRLLVALVFIFLLFRRLGAGAGPAVFGAVAAGFGAFPTVWRGWPVANSAVVLPLLLYALLVAAERGRRRDWILVSAAAFTTLVSGHPETLLYVVGLGGVFALGLVRRADRGHRAALLGRYAAAGAIALGLAAPALLPTLEQLPATHRYELLERRAERFAQMDPLAAWRSAETLSPELADAADRLALAVAPALRGDDLLDVDWGTGELYVHGTAFVGTLTLLLALLAYWPVRRRDPTGERRPGRLPFERAVLWVGLPVVAVVVARPPGLAHLFAALPVLDRSPVHHGRLTLVLGFLLAFLAVVTLERWRRAGSGWGRWVAALVPVVLAVATFAELSLFLAPANPTAPRELFYPQRDALDFLQNAGAEASGARIVGLGDALGPDIPSVYGLADPRISNPAKPWDYTLLVSPLLRSPRAASDVFEVASHPLYRLLGVSHLAIRDELPLEPWQPVHVSDGLLVYRAAESPLGLLHLPAAAVARGERWAAWAHANPDFGALTQADGGPLADGGRWTSVRPGDSVVERVSGGDPAGPSTHLTARASLVEPRLLGSSIYQDGGWRLLVDGRRQPTVRAHGPFVGAWLPQGAGRLDLVYRPPGFLGGCLLAALAWAMGCLWWVRPPTVVGRPGSG